MRIRFKSNFVFVIFTLLGLYLLNMGASLISLPEALEDIDNIILVISGILLILGGFQFIRLRKKRRHH